jgi:mRNA-degrading endonuclease RelE of RelBE toxin-antitoxin system
MERYRLRVPPPVVTLIRGLHPEIERRVRAGLEALVERPTLGKPLKDELQGLMSLRVGRLREVYRVAQEQVIEVIAVGPRRVIYEETLRLVRRGR